MEAAWERWEGFWVAGERRGAVLRAFDGDVLVTRVGFEDGFGSPFGSESLIRLSKDGDTWHAFRYRQEPGGLRSGARREEAGLGVDTLPAAGEHLLVARLAASSRQRAAYRRVDDACPEEPPAPAEVRRAGTETVELPDGRSLAAERLDVVAGGLRTASHWAHDGALVRSAWAGALSFPLGGEAEAIDGLGPALAQFLREGFGGD
ncbi:hypothetical protein [Sinomonas mesophila]|uniref:hypothetical protein n=1 Tax=Sinomonas mesophila TaxID=1531955 RepID=UPI00098607D1|nr:hypothetical protein [Sinomonas mesophila]